MASQSLIKRINLIARPLLQNCRLPTSCWGHIVLYVTALILLKPTTYHPISPLQLVRGKKTSTIFHLRKFSCVVHVSISPPWRTTMGPHQKLGTYIGFESPSIIKYLDPMTRDLHMARYADYIFDEDNFPALGGRYHSKEYREIN